MFRFTIRELLLLTLIVALALVWGLERRRSDRFRRDLELVQNELQLSRITIKTLYEDLDHIDRSLPPHGLTLVWSKDMRPKVQSRGMGSRPSPAK